MPTRKVQFRDDLIEESSCHSHDTASTTTTSTTTTTTTTQAPSFIGLIPAHLLWYSPAEYLEFRAQDAKSQQECLDSHLRRRDFVLGLLSQQHEHKLLGISDPKGLHMHSKACSKGSKQQARQTAIDVAREVGYDVTSTDDKKKRRAATTTTKRSSSCRSGSTRPRFMRYSAHTAMTPSATAA